MLQLKLTILLFLLAFAITQTNGCQAIRKQDEGSGVQCIGLNFEGNFRDLKNGRSRVL